ncbi:MAG: hypothetical protein ACRD1V_17055 [Vicinamibacterales bacterium]
MRASVRGVLVLVSVLIVACGGASVVSPTTVASVVTLNSGPYTLTLADAAGPLCANGVCAAVMECAGTGGPSAQSDTIAVTVQRAGDTVDVTPASGDSLRLSLQISGTSVTGTASGATTGASGLPIAASGTVSGGPGGLTDGASGDLNGQLTIGSTSCSSTAHIWRLAPR